MKTHPAMWGPSYGLADQIKAQDAAWKKLAAAGGALLKSLCDTRHQPQIDELEAALVELVTCGSSRQIEQIEEQEKWAKEFGSQFGSRSAFLPPTAEEQLIDLTEQRDKFSFQIEAVKKGMAAIPEDVRGMIEATALIPLQDQLSRVEERISNVQAALEALQESLNG